MKLIPVPSRTIRNLSLALLFALVAPALQAGSKVKVKGDIEEVTRQVEGALTELSIEQGDLVKTESQAVTRGKTRSGGKLTVAVNSLGDAECEVEISTETPRNREIEERFLRLMSSR